MTTNEEYIERTEKIINRLAIWVKSAKRNFELYKAGDRTKTTGLLMALDAIADNGKDVSKLARLIDEYEHF